MSRNGAKDLPADTQIRRARPEEWAVYRQVRLTALAEAPYAFMSTLEREQDLGEHIWRQRLGAPTAATFLAWRDGEPAGTATGKADDLADEYAVPGSWQLVGMWVDPRARGLGVADELVDTVASHARAKGAASLTLWVTEVNHRARAFYKKMGFVPTGARQPVRQEEPGLWEEQMIRQLG
jgi:ribosomal protein S18 acetylase RimI-like enzyme